MSFTSIFSKSVINFRITQHKKMHSLNYPMTVQHTSVTSQPTAEGGCHTSVEAGCSTRIVLDDDVDYELKKVARHAEVQPLGIIIMPDPDPFVVNILREDAYIKK